MKKLLLLTMLCLLMTPFMSEFALSQAHCNSMSTNAPYSLSFKELNAITQNPKSLTYLKPQINHLLATPFLYHYASMTNGRGQTLVNAKEQQALLRVASWNIERGFQLSHIIEILSGNLTVSQLNLKSKKLNDAKEEADWLAKSKVIMLTEVDDGMNRTNYQNVAKEMAKALHMNAVYGVEFLELGPLYMRRQQLTHHPDKVKSKNLSEGKNDPELEAYIHAAEIDPKRYRGLHGSAILTSYPILNVEVIRLPKVYDWYKQEREKLSSLEKVKRKAADTVFLEDVLTEIRLGSRLAIAVDVSIPELPEKKATFVVTHLENRVKPVGRKLQMDYLLKRLKNRHNPVVIGGDFNTTGTDVSPTSVKKEVRQYATDPTFWARRAIGLFSPFGLFVNLGLEAGQFSKNVFDPAAPNIPLLLPNNERALFIDIKNFQFADHTIFDTRGDKQHSFEHTHGFLGNSNERWLKGFVPTFSVERPLLKGLVGKYKLDWFLVKGYLKKAPSKSMQKSSKLAKRISKTSEFSSTSSVQKTYLFAPQAGRTLTQINHLYPEKLSDHYPITVDLALSAPENNKNQSSTGKSNGI